MEATAKLSRGEQVVLGPALIKLGGADAWFTPGRFAVFLSLLACASFPAVLLGKETFVFRDFGLFSYPVAFYHKECFWSGELPLWNPYNFCGLPFLAQWNTLVVYPFSLIYLLLPLTWSLPFFCLVHMWWGGLGMYFLAHHWTGNRLAGAFAGIVFAFNGLTQNFVMWPSHLATFSWVPWVLWLVPEGWRNGGRKLVLGVAVASMQMLAGGPETILFTWILLLLLTLGEWLQFHRSGGLIRVHSCSSVVALLRLMAIAALVALVCAAQLLPFVQLLSQSQRDSSYSQASYDWSMPAWGWANFLVPLFNNCSRAHGVYFQSEQNWTSSYYGGVATVLLAAFAFCRPSNWRIRLLGIAVFLSLMLAFGDHFFLFQGLRRVVPALGVIRYPVKCTILILAVAPLLAAIGLSKFLEWRKTPRSVWGLALVLLALIAAIIVWEWTHSIRLEVRDLTLRNGLARGLFLVITAVILSTLVLTQGTRKLLIGGLLLAVTWLDLATHVPNQNPTVQPQVYAAGWARKQLNWGNKPQPGESRVMLSPATEERLRLTGLPSLKDDFLVKRVGFFANANLLDKVPQVYGFFSLIPGPISELANLPYVQTNLDFHAIANFMGAARITAEDKVLDWTNNPAAIPFITAGQKPFFVNEQTALAICFQTNVNFQRALFLPKEAQNQTKVTDRTEARVLSIQYDTRKIDLRAETAGATFVVLAQTWYPCWKAYVDGRPARIWRANYAFQAVELSAGRHSIQLVYRDTTFIIGSVLSGVGLLACAVLWWRTRLLPCQKALEPK